MRANEAEARRWTLNYSVRKDVVDGITLALRSTDLQIPFHPTSVFPLEAPPGIRLVMSRARYSTDEFGNPSSAPSESTDIPPTHL